MEKRVKTATLNLRLEPSFKALAERAAAEDHRSLTSLIEKLLGDHLRRKGYLDRPEPSAAKRQQHIETARRLAEHHIDKALEVHPEEHREHRKRKLMKAPETRKAGGQR